MAAEIADAAPVQATAVFQYFVSRRAANIIQPDGPLKLCILL